MALQSSLLCESRVAVDTSKSSLSAAFPIHVSTKIASHRVRSAALRAPQSRIVIIWNERREWVVPLNQTNFQTIIKSSDDLATRNFVYKHWDKYIVPFQYKYQDKQSSPRSTGKLWKVNCSYFRTHAGNGKSKSTYNRTNSTLLFTRNYYSVRLFE